MYFHNILTHVFIFSFNLSFLFVVSLVSYRWSTAEEGFSRTKVNCVLREIVVDGVKLVHTVGAYSAYREAVRNIGHNTMILISARTWSAGPCERWPDCNTPTNQNEAKAEEQTNHIASSQPPRVLPSSYDSLNLDRAESKATKF